MHMYVCVMFKWIHMYVWVHVVCVCRPVANLRCHSSDAAHLILEISSFIGLKLGWQPIRLRDLPISTSPLLGLQECHHSQPFNGGS